MKLILLGIALILWGYAVNSITSGLGVLVFISLVSGLGLAIAGAVYKEHK